MSACGIGVAIAMSAASIVQGGAAVGLDAGYIHAERPRCHFRYDERLETRALQILHLQLGSDGAEFYDVKRPVVTLCRKKAILMFSGVLMPGGHTLLDPPNIYIDVDICTHRILAVDHDNGLTVSNTSPCA